MASYLHHNIKIEDNDSHIALIDIQEALQSVYDPDIHETSIYDLGLIYEIHLSPKSVKVIMTLTSASCPEAESLPELAKDAIISKLNDEEITVDIEVVFEPAWNIDMMSEETLLKLGLL